ncbi:PAS domain-containing protein [Amylibacter sp. SFDW26]|uniref:PAS domain-containing protein n=1 Tax=Amylibacter sp. SFDW26 TaxID=2652722 RepID=UPI00186A8128|nr:PAS domain-containing protein [Amylibacter sp. SFDW26]
MQNTKPKTGVILQMPAAKQPMKDKIADEVLSHWESLRNGRLVPKRSDVDPRALKKALNYTFILEQHTNGDLKFRLAGSKVCDCMGMEVRGMPAHAIIDVQDRDRFQSALHRLQKVSEIIDMQLTQGARLILLPLSDENNDVSRVLGCLIANPDRPVFPTRMGILSINAQRVVNAPSVKALELAETQTPFRPRIKKAARSGPPVLKLVK